MIPYAPFAPDRSALDPAVSDTILNVLPKANSYGPMASFAAFSQALPDPPKGAFLARDNDGAYHTFAGTRTGLYKLNDATLAWEDVSGASAPYDVDADKAWSFTQFGDYVVAANAADDPQYYDLSISTDFADLAGSPPKAAYCGVSGDFLILLGTDGNNKQMAWSGLNDPTWWTPGRHSADVQQFPDGGAITGYVGSQYGGVIFQEYAIRAMQPEQTGLVFTFTKTDESRGVQAPGSIVAAGPTPFFFSQDGFYRYGMPSQPIGAELVDRWFIDQCDPMALHLVEAVHDPINKVVFWRFQSKLAVATDVTDKIVAYDYGVERWTAIDVELTGFLPAVTPGYTLEGLDALGYTIETLPHSLDSRAWMGGAPVLAGFDTSYRMGLFSGAAMAATLETADIELTPGRRSLVTGVRPLGDAASPTVAVAAKDVHGSARLWRPAAAINRTGIVPARASGRLHRFRTVIPAGAAWQHAHGVEPVAVPEGIQ